MEDSPKIYIINDDRKFDSTKSAEKEVERVRASVCRLKKRKNCDTKVLAYVSEINIKLSDGKYQYLGSKKNGAKKEFVGNYTTKAQPHIHWIIIGDKASTVAGHIINSFKKTNPDTASKKQKLHTLLDYQQYLNYVEEQALYKRTF